MASNEEVKNEQMRTFNTGATRNSDTERIDPEGFLSWRPLEAYFNYMHKNRFQKDGNIRDSDNWQLGIPQRAYGKSLWRHFFDFWKTHRTVGNHKVEPSPYRNDRLIEDGVAIMFNIMGYLDVELQKPPREYGLVYDLMEREKAKISEQRYARERNSWPRTQLLEDCSNNALDEIGYGSGV